MWQKNTSQFSSHLIGYSFFVTFVGSSSSSQLLIVEGTKPQPLDPFFSLWIHSYYDIIQPRGFICHQ